MYTYIYTYIYIYIERERETGGHEAGAESLFGSGRGPFMITTIVSSSVITIIIEVLLSLSLLFKTVYQYHYDQYYYCKILCGRGPSEGAGGGNRKHGDLEHNKQTYMCV